MSLSARRQSFVAAVALPPPLHGQSVVNRAVSGAVATALQERVRVVDIGPGVQASKGLGYHATRLARTCVAALQVWRLRGSTSRRLYTVYESGAGVLYNAILLWAARCAGAEVVLHHHTAAHALTYCSRFGILMRLWGRGVHQVALCKRMGDDLRRLYPNCGKVLVSSNAYALDLPAATEARRARGPICRLGHLSNLCAEKGTLRAIDLHEELVRRGMNVHLNLAGPIVDASVARAIKDAVLRHPDKVQYLGPVYGEKKSRFFEEIDVFVFLTSYRYEAQPLVLLEAMASGVPVVASSAGYIADMLVDNSAAIPLDADALERACDEVERLWSNLDVHSATARSQYLQLLEKSRAEFDALRGVLTAGLMDDDATAT